MSLHLAERKEHEGDSTLSRLAGCNETQFSLVRVCPVHKFTTY